MWTMSVLISLCLLLMYAATTTGYERGYCPISLPHKASAKCYTKRLVGLARQRKTWQLSPPKYGMPYARLNVTPSQYPAFLKDKPFLGMHAKVWTAQVVVSRKSEELYKKWTKSRPEDMTYREYIEMYGFFRSTMENALGHPVRLPSKYELFQMDITKYLSDQMFTEQRLAGVNPVSLQRVTLSKKVGLNWKGLSRKNLNPAFDWKKAIGTALDMSIKYDDDLEWVVEEGLLFALRYPLCDDMVFMKEIVDNNVNRTLWPFYSPIALFASVHDRETVKLVPVAIQMDYKKDSAVFTPKDGGKWTLAKLNVQVTDSGYSQMVEHLSNSHFVAEAVCVSMERYLSHRHPLYAILRYHCRGVLTANVFGAPTLLLPKQYTHLLFAFGWRGAFKLVKGASKVFDWNSLKLDNEIKKRGVGDEYNLPYYPYRDDGRNIAYAIKKFVKDYVKLYYKSNRDVFYDKELQHFLKEVSEQGNGKLRGFPASINTVWKLCSTLSTFLWVVTGRHASVSYPLMDYNEFIPTAPTKLYNDTSAPAGRFSLLNLPQRSVSEVQMQLQQTLGSLRYDRLFDYGPLLEDEAARKVLNQHYCKLYDELEPHLIEENKRRYEEGHLTYPYLMPRWLPNSIQT